MPRTAPRLGHISAHLYPASWPTPATITAPSGIRGGLPNLDSLIGQRSASTYLRALSSSWVIRDRGNRPFRRRCRLQAIPPRSRPGHANLAGNRLGAGLLGARPQPGDGSRHRRAFLGRYRPALAADAMHHRSGECRIVACGGKMRFHRASAHDV